MKLHTVFITHNRLELTKIAIETYLETVTLPYTLLVVDNASTDGTPEWIMENLSDYSLLSENRYPGFACNTGWSRAPADATHLQRADNDFRFLPGWCDAVEEAFTSRKKPVGQVGLRTGAEEMYVPLNVGGNNVILKALFDNGLRYREEPWTDRSVYLPGFSEDSFFSPAVRKMGYRWTRVKRPCIEPISVESWEDPYYQHSWGARGLRPN